MSNTSLRSIDVFQKRKLNFREINLTPVNDEPVEPTQYPQDEPTLKGEILPGKPILKALAEKFNAEVRVKKILETNQQYTKDEAVEVILDIIGGYEEILASSVIHEKGGSFCYFNPYTGKEETYKDQVLKPRFTIKTERKGFRKKAEALFVGMIEKGSVEAINQTDYYLVVK